MKKLFIAAAAVCLIVSGCLTLIPSPVGRRYCDYSATVPVVVNKTDIENGIFYTNDYCFYRNHSDGKYSVFEARKQYEETAGKTLHFIRIFVDGKNARGIEMLKIILDDEEILLKAASSDSGKFYNGNEEWAYESLYFLLEENSLQKIQKTSKSLGIQYSGKEKSELISVEEEKIKELKDFLASSIKKEN